VRHDRAPAQADREPQQAHEQRDDEELGANQGDGRHLPQERVLPTRAPLQDRRTPGGCDGPEEAEREEAVLHRRPPQGSRSSMSSKQGPIGSPDTEPDSRSPPKSGSPPTAELRRGNQRSTCPEEAATEAEEDGDRG